MSVSSSAKDWLTAVFFDAVFVNKAPCQPLSALENIASPKHFVKCLLKCHADVHIEKHKQHTGARRSII